MPDVIVGTKLDKLGGVRGIDFSPHQLAVTSTVNGSESLFAEEADWHEQRSIMSNDRDSLPSESLESRKDPDAVYVQEMFTNDWERVSSMGEYSTMPAREPSW